MSLAVLKAASEVENNDELHMARLLLLIHSADALRKTPDTKAKAIEGITKLAKLDFLLRYPLYLERALAALGKQGSDVDVKPRERTSVETKMIRFRYGPWDGRYRRWLGLLVARGLIKLSLDRRRTVQVGLTDRGRELASIVAGQPTFEDLAKRGMIVAKSVGGMSATKLKDFVYKIVPEINGMRWGEEIDAAGVSQVPREAGQ